MDDMIPQNNTLQTLLNTFIGKKTTTSTSSGVSSAGMSEMLKSILGSTQGLAQLSQGQKSAGLYNSTVNQQLTNDLLSRSAAEVSKVGYGSTSTTKIAPQIDPKNALLATLGLSAGKSLLGPTITGLSKKYGDLDELGTKLADSLGVGSSSISSAGDIAAAGDIGAGLPFGGDSLADLVSSVGADFASTVAGDVLSSVGGSFAGDAGGSFLDGLAGAIGGLKDGGTVAPADRALSERLQARGKGVSPTLDEIFRYLSAYPINYEGMRSANQSFGKPGQDEMIMKALQGPMGADTLRMLEDLIAKTGRESDAAGDREKNKMGGKADGGVITRRRPLRASGSAAAEGSNNNGTAGIGDSVSEGVAAPGSAVSLGALGSIGMGVASMNPVGIAMGVANAISSITTGKSLLANLMSKMNQSDPVTAATPESIAQAFASLDSNITAQSIGDAAIGDSGIGPGSNAGSAEGSVGGSGDADGGVIPHQSNDPKGIKDTLSSTVKGKKGPNLSGGEFIIPADVVRAKGTEFFDKLVEQFHVPAALQ